MGCVSSCGFIFLMVIDFTQQEIVKMYVNCLNYRNIYEIASLCSQ